MDRLNREHQIWAPLGIRLNWHDGLSIKFPVSEHSFHLKVTALHNGAVVWDCDVPPTARQERIYHTTQTYNIPWQVEIRQADGRRLFFWRTDLTGRDVCLRFLTESLGDVIAWMAVADRFHRIYNCWMAIQMKREFIPLFAAIRPRFHFIEESAFKAGDYDAVFPISPSEETIFAPVPYSRVNPFTYAQNLLAVDNPLEIPALVEQPASVSRPAEKYACLLTGKGETELCGMKKAEWAVVASFLRENGYETVTLDDTAPLLENLSLLQGARFAIGVMTPLLWLAWASKKDAVQLVGTGCENQIPASEFRVTRPENGTSSAGDAITSEEVIGVIKTVPAFLKEYRKNHPLDNSVDFSVLVPVHNGEKTLKRCLDSILNQTCGNFELIACNDGSTDNTQAILDAYAKQDSRVRLLNHPVNQGRMATRRDLAQAATKAYTVWVDCDDEIAPDYLETASRALAGKDCDVAALRCELRLAYSGIRRAPVRGGIVRGDSMLSVFLKNDAFLDCFWGKAFRTSLLKKAVPTGFDKLLQEDMFFMLPLYEQAKSFLYVPSARPMYIYYGDTGEWSSKLHNMTPELFEEYCLLRHEQIVFSADYLTSRGYGEDILRQYIQNLGQFQYTLGVLESHPAWWKQGVEIFLKWFCKEPNCLLNDGKVKLPDVAAALRRQVDAIAGKAGTAS